MKTKATLDIRMIGVMYDTLLGVLKTACGAGTAEGTEIDTEDIKSALLEIQNQIPKDICEIVQIERGLKAE